jgi:hypothetical protein
LKRTGNGAAKRGYDELPAMVQQLKAKVAAGTPALKLKVPEKQALSVCGLSRFPVTLCAAQWESLLHTADVIKAFIAANEDKLSRK